MCRPPESSLSDDEDDGEDSDQMEDVQKRFAFPDLDSKIRETVAAYGAVFPKLNFSSPRGCEPPPDSSAPSAYQLELVLRKWYPVDRSRELRCFVRQEVLVGISQRDPNYYDFWNEPDTQSKVIEAVTAFWETKIKGKWEVTNGDYTFDFLLTRDLSRGHILDFNPYAPRTDPLLFTYEELLALLAARTGGEPPELRVVDSPNHPAATRNAPMHQHNMLPIEALAMSSGRDVQEFQGCGRRRYAGRWKMRACNFVMHVTVA
ncbi:hypothetical protein A0H81_08731 [Grifola frondosa]|uniref:Uncharacterized protein n=1 Tax=Grifola frondosa TaxID=5627 RepID=A0A1C7M2X5_GRIFR|nr:hypothetical protein A0H81_08731 [Grifola frondosa]